MIRKRRARGFTLLEVMAALAVMAVAITVLLVERNTAIERTGRTQNRRAALQLAEEKMQEILLGLETAGAGEFDGRPGFQWSVSEEMDVVEAEGGSSRLLKRFVVEVRFPLKTTEDRVVLSASARE